MSGKCNRKRPYRIYIYVSKEELDEITSKAKMAGLSVGEFGRRVFRKEKIIVPPSADERELIMEVRRIGSNLNQIVRKYHALDIDPSPALEMCVKDIEYIKKLLEERRYDGSNINMGNIRPSG